jgi:hypothetical protein
LGKKRETPHIFGVVNMRKRTLRRIRKPVAGRDCLNYTGKHGIRLEYIGGAFSRKPG